MKNILFVGAHFDDIELGCGGTVAKFKAQNKKVIGCVLTDSAYTNFDGSVYRSKEKAVKEGINAAKVLGMRLEYSDFETKKIEFTSEVVEYLNKIIIKYDIDTIFTHWINDIHHDHIAVARASLIAARHIPNVYMYRSNWYISPESFKSNYFVDISDFAQIKVKAIKKHVTEYRRRGQEWIQFFF